MERFELGLIGEARSVVTEKDTAAHLGSGTVPVFGTPALVGLMEAAAVQALADYLPVGQTSVGARIDVRHLAPTPVGMHVRARAELVETEGRRVSFRIEAWDEVEQIGEATHERIIIDAERFVAGARAKGR
jgi:fluoroacetyl-CoA thioesterase